MASANGSPECSGNGSSGGGASDNSSAAVPQWKRDLIQRRRQQNKVLTNNGASVKLCSAVTGTFANNNGAGNVDAGSFCEPVERSSTSSEEQQQQQCVGVAGIASSVSSRTRTPDSISSCTEYSSSCQHPIGSSASLRCQTPSGATGYHEPHESLAAASGEGGEEHCGETIGNGNSGVPSVVCNMRLEADASSLCPSSEDVPNCNSRNNQRVAIGSGMERGNLEFENYENEETLRNYANSGVCNKPPRAVNNKDQDTEQDSRNRASRIIRRMDKESTVGGVGGNISIFPNEQSRKLRIDKSFETKLLAGNGNRPMGDECESDSSEELQYGPGIVDRLKSKYLNLTLRETNQSRATVQRFRRAASLEDLLDCDEEPGEKSTRKYTKRSSPGTAPQGDRYRNASRGNESMKRARSVETLMRYNTPLTVDESLQSNRFTALRQEPVNDHIVLIDRTTVKIESRLTDPDRPKAINKPKRIKPLLAETERPPPDLVKTTMRIFEGSVKKFKPKGEVAVKVATFKTINDTYKAQAIKKMVPKPPIQPKPFVNGNSKGPGSPKKILLPQIPTAELIEKPEVLEEYRNDGVVTDPIVQSVSSVVSKFQQIEKSHSPSPSPEPMYKLKFSPAPSPEPLSASKFKASTESLVKSPPVTPVPSPRISSPGVPSPASPKKDLLRQNSSPVHPPSSPNRELFRQASAPEAPKQSPRAEDRDAKETTAKPIVEDSRQQEQRDSNRVAKIVREESKPAVEDEENSTIVSETSDETEAVDGSRTISKLALENISKAGSTVQFNFGDKTNVGKSYLPGAPTQNGQKLESPTNGVTESSKPTSELKIVPPVPENCSSPLKITEDQTTRLQERLESDKSPETKTLESTPSPNVHQSEYTKPIGAISSLALIKSPSPTTTTCYPQSNDSKTIRSQKSDISSPQKQIGIIRPLVSTKTQISQQNLSNRELEKNLINRVKSIEQPTKVVVSLKSAEEIQPVKKTATSPGGGGGGGGGGLWDTKPWNQANNTMVFNFSNRKDVPDYIENDGLIIRRKREKPKVGDGGVIVLDATLDASSTDDSDWEISGGPPSPCDVSFTNDNVLINGRSNLSKQPRNHKHRIQFDDSATRTFEYPSEASMLEDEGTSVDGDTSSAEQPSPQGANKSPSASSASTMSSALLGGGGLASFTPSKVDLASEGFELGVTRTAAPTSAPAAAAEQPPVEDGEEYLKSAQDAAAWGAEANADLLY